MATRFIRLGFAFPSVTSTRGRAKSFRFQFFPDPFGEAQIEFEFVDIARTRRARDFAVCPTSRMIRNFDLSHFGGAGFEAALPVSLARSSAGAACPGPVDASNKATIEATKAPPS